MTLWNKTWHVCSLPHKHSHTHPTSSPAIASSPEISFFISLLRPRLLESFLSQSLSVARAPTRHLFPPRSLNISLLSSLLLSISPEFHHFGSLRKSCWHFSRNFFSLFSSLATLETPRRRPSPPHLSRSHRYHSDLFTRVLLFIRSLPCNKADMPHASTLFHTTPLSLAVFLLPALSLLVTQRLSLPHAYLLALHCLRFFIFPSRWRLGSINLLEKWDFSHVFLAVSDVLYLWLELLFGEGAFRVWAYFTELIFRRPVLVGASPN